MAQSFCFLNGLAQSYHTFTYLTVTMEDLRSFAPAVIVAPKGAPPKVGQKRKRDADDDEREVEGEQSSACWVCGKQFASMPPKSKYCWKHKQSVESMETAYTLPRKKKLKGEINPLQAQLDKLNELKAEKNPPPSNFSAMVLAYDRDSPALGIGVKRRAFDLLQQYEKHSA